MVKMQWNTIDQIPVTKENIDKILEFLPYFEDEANKFFEHIPPKKEKTGIYHIPYYDPAPQILDFIHILQTQNFLLPYDWDNDMPRILGLINRFRPMSEANLLDIRKIFITLSVGEKFCDGYLANAVNRGIVLDALKRLEEIRKEM